jgi:hypothetical protein
MLAYANQKSIPVWTEIKLLDFLKMKDEATFSHISWMNHKLAFDINSSLKNSNVLTFMVPAEYNGLRVKKISLDGHDARIITRSVKGSDYVFASVGPGKNHSVIVNY